MGTHTQKIVFVFCFFKLTIPQDFVSAWYSVRVAFTTSCKLRGCASKRRAALTGCGMMVFIRSEYKACHLGRTHKVEPMLSHAGTRSSVQDQIYTVFHHLCGGNGSRLFTFRVSGSNAWYWFGNAFSFTFKQCTPNSLKTVSFWC